MSNDPKDNVVDFSKQKRRKQQPQKTRPNISSSEIQKMITKCNESKDLVGTENFTHNNKNNQAKDN